MKRIRRFIERDVAIFGLQALVIATRVTGFCVVLIPAIFAAICMGLFKAADYILEGVVWFAEKTFGRLIWRLTKKMDQIDFEHTNR